MQCVHAAVYVALCGVVAFSVMGATGAETVSLSLPDGVYGVFNRPMPSAADGCMTPNPSRSPASE